MTYLRNLTYPRMMLGTPTNSTVSAQIGTLNKQNAILTTQLAASMKLIPKDVLDSLDKENTNAED